ncbi:hypothetical protein ODV97_02045 [Enterococcus gallinarum]|nr:hypothetical protein [Enterococcus gallinarum]
MNYFKNLLAKSIRQRRFLFTMIAAFLIGVGLAFYLTFMEPVNVQAEITMQKAQALRLVDNYQNYPNESQDKQETYQLLLANNTLSNRQASNLIMEEFLVSIGPVKRLQKFSCNYGKPLYQIKPFYHLSGNCSKIKW